VDSSGATVLGTVKDGRSAPAATRCLRHPWPPLCAVAAGGRRDGKRPEPSTSLRRVEQEAGLAGATVGTACLTRQRKGYM